MNPIEDFTDREVLSESIGILRSLVINKISSLDDNDDEKDELINFQRLLRWESQAVLGTDEIACSIQDKVRRTYNALIKSYINGN